MTVTSDSKGPEKGSLGASGDLAPLSHMVLVLIGLGEAFVVYREHVALGVFHANRYGSFYGDHYFIFRNNPLSRCFVIQHTKFYRRAFVIPSAKATGFFA